MKPSDFVKYLQRMIALTDTGLTFTKDPFDRERYEDLRSLLSEMLNQVSDLDADEVAELLKPTSAYATPLMDVRAWIVEDEKICLVRGQGENDWALPGGFGEVGYSPTENILKEIEEETGFKAKVGRLLAVFDTNRFQLQSKQYAKFVFECKLLDGQFQENQEIADLQFFAIDQLPNLSEKRITKEQIEILWQVYQGQREQYLD
ncbi:MutT/nudix family protein [Streptococcus pneumoniae]|uniref:NUDIX hydrolase N-terminal domain-containing protein n=1 Tax=Streptococcus pneumoniae TaxID=1313 RepID=UPI00102FE9B6|nr:NUDIX hydrolase [Streptococcus pneumoniae]MDV8710983.1 NUDIX hydrolase [Streptococcus pneumoniae]VJG03681.1 MutT/nudix family protein [Streptococcus pneumoniae]VNL98307.1 MutT/nudix family protein [Streptococcus pneumoniae]VPK19896.1 MutT/nudix family protein [Streptococcus pneumoniae]VPP07007.1 MutT/nudix family protein [Streptococcus pneumoniae]